MNHSLLFLRSIRWDNGAIPKGEKRNHLIGLNDLFATICDLVGVSVPINQAIDSVSFSNYIFNETNIENLRTYLGTWAYGTRLAKSSIRKDNLKLIHDYRTNEMELYDLDADVEEKNNILSTTRLLDTDALSMFRELQEFGPCYDSTRRFKVQGSFRKCWWFRAKTSRCYRYIEGIYNCRKTCAMLKDRNDCRV